MKSFFTPKEVAALVGISYRQIQYWDKTNFIKPSYRRHGKYRLYTYSDLCRLKSAEILRKSEYNYSVQRLRRVMHQVCVELEKVRSPLLDVSLVVQGEEARIIVGLLSSLFPGMIMIDFSSIRSEINKQFPNGISADDDIDSLPDAA